jgi:hypothetical protein
LPRRVSLPTADDLFRPTTAPKQPPPGEPSEDDTRTEGGEPGERSAKATPNHDTPAEAPAATAEPAARSRKPSGRVRHDEKMTVYVTADELLDLEHARLRLRRETGLAVDRGRLVREAVAIALADLDAHGEDSLIVQRLKQS